MTRDTILAQLAQAKAALAVGNCDRAVGAIELAWQDLGAFTQSLIAARRSTSPARAMYKRITQAAAVIQRRCGGESLVAPSYRGRGGADLLPPTFMPVRQNPDLLAPSFSGALVEGDPGQKPWIGLGIAVGLLSYGLWCLRQ